MTDINWQCEFFDALAAYELYAAIRLRNEVFVVEQNCVFQDADNKDQKCYHLLGWHQNELVAYARLVPAGLSYAEPAIGRIVTSPAFRKHGAGKALLKEAIRLCILIFNEKKIRIGAQLYLKKFYESFGFKQSSEIYLEDNIEHIEMVLEN